MRQWLPGAACAGLAFLIICPLLQRGASGAQERDHASAVKRKKHKPPPALDLRQVEAVRFPVHAPVAMSVRNYCDNAGNIYMVYNAARTRKGPVPNALPNLQNEPITKLSLDSQSLTRYTTQQLDGYQSFQRWGFNVDAFGKVYALFYAQRSSLATNGAGTWRWVIGKFNGDGGVDSIVLLQNPPSGWLQPSQFAAFSDGNFLVTGFVNSLIAPTSERPAHKAASFRQTPFTAIFDSSGQFVQEVTLPGHGHRDVNPSRAPKGSSGKPGTTRGPANRPDAARKTEDKSNPFPIPPGDRRQMDVVNSFTVSGTQDTVYLLRPSSPAILYTLSSSGQVVHEAHIKYPGPHLFLLSMSAAGQSNVWVQFAGMKASKRGGFRAYFIFALVDPATGEISAVYRPPSNNGQMFACAAGPDSLEFIGSTKNGQLKVVKYSAN